MKAIIARILVTDKEETEQDNTPVLWGHTFFKVVGRLIRPPRVASLHNRQLRQHRLIKKINGLLEPFILHERSICPLSRLDRSVSQQMLNICDGSTSTQQASGKRLSQIVSRNVSIDLPQSCQSLGR